MNIQNELDLNIAPIPGFISSHCRYIDDSDVNRHILIKGTVAYIYRIGDKIQQRNVILCLYRTQVATQVELAKAFKVTTRSIGRWITRYAKQGLEGLVDKARSGAPEKINDKVCKRIIELRANRLKVNEIAQTLNIGLGSVCRVLYPQTVDEQVNFFETGDDAIDSEIDVSINNNTSEPTEVEQTINTHEATDEQIGREEAQELIGDYSGADKEVTAVAQSDITINSIEAEQVSESDAEIITDKILTADTDPRDRSADRTAALCGLLEEAQPLFVTSERMEFVGVLLACVTEEFQNYVRVVKKVYKSFGASFYGVRGIFLTFIMMAFLRIKNCEQIREYNQLTVGKLLGLDRAPEVKTLRRKLRLLYARKKAMECMDELTRLRLKSQKQHLFATAYIDGHVKSYYGKHKVAKTYSTRLHKTVKASTDYWVNLIGGMPLCVVAAECNEAMTAMLVQIIEDIKKICIQRGVDLPIIVFDRGGYSGEVFEKLLIMKVDFITYNRDPIDPIDSSEFRKEKTVINERVYEYAPVERETTIAVYTTVKGVDNRYTRKNTGRTVSLREILIRRDNGAITSILASIRNLPLVETAQRLFKRWGSQENFLKYMREEFALDHLNSYGVENISKMTDHPNPEYVKIQKEIQSLNNKIHKQVGRRIMKQMAEGVSADQCAQLHKKLGSIKLKDGSTITESINKISALRMLLSKIPQRITVHDYKQLKTESRSFHNFIKVATYNAESELVEILRNFYHDHNGDARTVLSAMFKSSGMITIEGNNLVVSIESQSSPQRTQVMKNLCDILNKRKVCYPGSQLFLTFRPSD